MENGGTTERTLLHAFGAHRVGHTLHIVKHDAQRRQPVCRYNARGEEIGGDVVGTDMRQQCVNGLGALSQSTRSPRTRRGPARPEDELRARALAAAAAELGLTELPAPMMPQEAKHAHGDASGNLRPFLSLDQHIRHSHAKRNAPAAATALRIASIDLPALGRVDNRCRVGSGGQGQLQSNWDAL